ncbi:MAG: M48 family metallopeptidase [Clostridia bacterium]|nr:M48 family metallopeptidase [Clostridia bacterium]
MEGQLPIVVIRARRKSLTLTVNRKGEVIVRAPYRVAFGEIEKFVQLHRDWIERRISEKARGEADLSDGAEYDLFGERVVLACGRTRCTNSVLYLPQSGRETAFRNFLIALARDTMTRITDEIASAYGFSYQGLRISGARGRWGSCSATGKIAYSFRIAFLPTEICRAIAAHELCHTRVFNHGSAFWNEVAQIVPDYSSVRKYLKAHQYVMNYL